MSWYEKGIRFECQGSGKCCVSHGEYGYVYLSKKDRRQMAKFLGLSLSEFVENHCQTTGGFLHLKKMKFCEFLEGKRCSVYEARPTQCRTWPFWPDTMNAKAWKNEVASFCPGVGKGRLYSAKEIEDLVRETEDIEQFLV